MSLVTYFKDDVMGAPQNIRFLVAPMLLRPGNTSLLISLNYCVPSFDKFCYTRIQVSVKDLDPSIIPQA